MARRRATAAASSLGLGPGARVALLAGLQAALGGLNVVLLAPVWLQLVHLLVADLLWISVVLLAAAVLAGRAPAIRGGRRGRSRRAQRRLTRGRDPRAALRPRLRGAVVTNQRVSAVGPYIAGTGTSSIRR